MNSVQLTFGLLALSLSFPSPVIAQPICYIVNSAGRTTNLTSMCGSSAKVTTATRSQKSSINLDTPERRIKLGKTSDGFDVFFDRDSVKAKTFDLKTGNNAATYNFEYAYACSEKRVFLEGVSITNAATGKTYPLGDGNSTEMQFDQGSMADTGLQLACRQTKSPGY